MLVFIICLGLSVGSFINVAYRRFSPSLSHIEYLQAISVKRSKCLNCGSTLALWQLIPVISWLILKGRCYYCHCKISLHYLVLELLLATLFTLIYIDRGLNSHSLLMMMLSGFFILLALIDFKYYLLPDFFTQPLMWLGLIASYFELTSVTLNDAFLGILLGYSLLKIPATLFFCIFKKAGLGGGDIKLLAAFGAWLPYYLLPWLVVIACLLGIIYYLCLRYLLAKHQVRLIPFAPFLSFSGYCLSYFCQELSEIPYVLV